MSNVSKIWKLDPHRTRKGQSYEEKNSIMDYDSSTWCGSTDRKYVQCKPVFAEEQTEEQNAESEEETEQTDTDDSVMKIGALKGPTAMGMAQLLDDENYEFSIVAHRMKSSR